MTILSAYKSDVGQHREHNEDYIWVDEQAGLYIVADGMGGHEAGEVASELASTTIGEMVAARLKADATLSEAETIREMMVNAIETANQSIYQAAQDAEQVRPMGTTIVVAITRPPVAFISHVGDARAYLVRGTTLTRLTEDDTWGAQFDSMKLPASLGGAERAKYNSILTKAVGQGSVLEPSFLEIKIEAGDWLLLCSDGLWNMVPDEQILTIFRQTTDGHPADIVDALVAAANAAGGKDNISVITLKYTAAN